MGFHRAPHGAAGLAALVFIAGLSLAGCHRSSGGTAPRIVINEISANGAATDLRLPGGEPLLDATGGPVDWIEVYNPLPDPVNLSGFSLTDDPEKPRKFRFPPLLLNPGGFVVVIADGRPEAGPLHADFKLGTQGEDVILYGLEGRDLVDRRTYREMEADAVAGRYPDGARDESAYAIIYVPTPGLPNRRPGIKPPRILGAPGVTPEGNPETSTKAFATIAVTEDVGAEIQEAFLERAMNVPCTGPLDENDLLPGRFLFVETGRSEPRFEKRRDVYGKEVLAAQQDIVLATIIPKEPDGSIVRFRSTVANVVAETIRLDCHRFGPKTTYLAINEFQPSNRLFYFDVYQQNGVLDRHGVTPDWIEIFNYGDLAIEIGDFSLVTSTAVVGWHFRDVGIERIGPKEHLLILADDDNPNRNGVNSYYRSGPPEDPVRPPGPGDRVYRSTTFRLAADRRDTFYLLDAGGLVIDAAEFDFSGLKDGAIPAELSFGRFPDADDPNKVLGYPNDATHVGKLLACPTPEAPNQEVCDVDVAPRFSGGVFTDPRCPDPQTRETVMAFLAIDRDTATADSPSSPTFTVDLEYTAGGKTEVLSRGMEGFRIEPLDLGQLPEWAVQYPPVGIIGAQFYLVEVEIPAQPEGTLTTFLLRAKDLVLNQSAEVGEAQRPLESFRFKSGYAAPPVEVNEIFPKADPAAAAPLHMDSMELFNRSDSRQDLSGMYLHVQENPARLGPQGKIREFQFPPDTFIEPFGFLPIYFPEAGEEGKVPSGAIAATGMVLDDCKGVLYLLASDEDGNCLVSEGWWDIEVSLPEGGKDCLPGTAVGRIPDGYLPRPDIDMYFLERPSPGALNCGERLPEFSREPFHYKLTAPGKPFECLGANDMVAVEAWVLVGDYAATVYPAPVQGKKTGIRKAELLLGADGAKVVEMQRYPLNPPEYDPSKPREDSDCWIQVKLQGFVSPPHPAVTWYRVRVVDGLDNVLESDLRSFGLAAGKPDVAINEAMAVNTVTLPDEDGDHVPWIEIYNPGPAEVNLGGMSLADSLADPGKWWEFPRIPESRVPAGDFLIVFADGEAANALDLHASISLKASGPGILYLIDSVEGGLCILDVFSYDFTGLPPDTSMGRKPDGSGSVLILPRPSPGEPNEGVKFLRGDCTLNGRVNVSDLTWFYQILFLERTPAPTCQKVLDVDDDGQVDLNDGVFLGNFLFLGGPWIPHPYPEVGFDPTPDDLPCR